jgi:hypothetical protein
MTQEEVLSLQPGRCLDALVAEKVMDWTELSVLYENAYGQRPFAGMDSLGFPPGPGCERKTIGGHAYWTVNKATPVPAFSQEIAAAWLVVEKLIIDPPEGSYDYGPWWDIEGPSPGSPLWGAGWKYGVDYEGESWLTSGAGETAPLAICRAALNIAFAKAGAKSAPASSDTPT